MNTGTSKKQLRKHLNKNVNMHCILRKPNLKHGNLALIVHKFIPTENYFKIQCLFDKYQTNNIFINVLHFVHIK